MSEYTTKDLHIHREALSLTLREVSRKGKISKNSSSANRRLDSLRDALGHAMKVKSSSVGLNQLSSVKVSKRSAKVQPTLFDAKPSISVVIPSRNRAKHLQCLLDSLELLTGRIPVEVTLVDGQSTDDSFELLDNWQSSHHPFNVKVVRQEGGEGPGHARNLGIDASSGEIIAFTDDDCVVHPQWLEKLVSHLNPESMIVGVGGRVLSTRRDTFSRYYSFHRVHEPPPSLLYLVTANCCYLKQPLLEIGGFDEDIRKLGGEDVGLSFKLAKAGWRFDYSAEAIVYHNYRPNPIDFVRTFRNYGEGCRQVTEKHLGSIGSIPEAQSLTWGYDTLRPPRLTAQQLASDLEQERILFREARFSPSTIIAFLVLRLLQRISYNYGWSQS